MDQTAEAFDSKVVIVGSRIIPYSAEDTKYPCFVVAWETLDHHPSTFDLDHQCRNCFIAWVIESGIVTATFIATAFNITATTTTTAAIAAIAATATTVVVTRFSKYFQAGKLGHYLMY